MPLRLLLPQLVPLFGLAATAGMFGIIWIVQLAIYPLFSKIGIESFPTYHAQYMAAVTWVIAPLMLIEATACAWQLFHTPKDRRIWATTALLAIIWLSTAFIQVPLHQNITQDDFSTLTKSNWLRTFAWSLRLPLLLVIFLFPSSALSGLRFQVSAKDIGNLARRR